MEYIVNFNGVKTEKEFYDKIIEGLEFPQWCGKNPDAIWDMFTGYAEYPAVIYLRGVQNVPKILSIECDTILRVFKRTEKWFGEMGYDMKFIIID